MKRPREGSVESTDSKNMSKRKMKKLRKLQHNPNKNFHGRRGVDKCVDCPNPVVSIVFSFSLIGILTNII